jgi:hypothetical protein
MPIILYTAQVSNWSLSQNRSLNAPFNENYRKLLSLLKKSPEAITYLPNKYCGIGLPKVSDLAQKYKWDNLLRCQALGKSPNRCMNELLDRIPAAKQPLAILLVPCNPTDQLLGLHIKRGKPQPGMNAYTLELLAVVVGLHTMWFMPSVVKGFSDCMSAIIRLKDAILAFHNTQSSDTAGILISGGYQFQVTKEDIKDITIKRFEIDNPRLILWIRSHPEKDERAHNPDELAKDIFMADTV